MEKIDLHEPDPEVIKTVEELLEMAREGKVIGFAAFLRCQGGVTATLRAGEISRPLTIGQMELLKYNLLKDWSGEGEQ